jgi:hypothetical protein
MAFHRTKTWVDEPRAEGSDAKVSGKTFYGKPKIARHLKNYSTNAAVTKCFT